MPDLYETYVRTAEGDTYHPEDIREGIEQFLSDNGYRLSFNIDGVVITLRRDTEIEPKLDEFLHQRSVYCAVTIR